MKQEKKDFFSIPVVQAPYKSQSIQQEVETAQQQPQIAQNQNTQDQIRTFAKGGLSAGEHPVFMKKLNEVREKFEAHRDTLSKVSVVLGVMSAAFLLVSGTAALVMEMLTRYPEELGIKNYRMPFDCEIFKLLATLSSLIWTMMLIKSAMGYSSSKNTDAQEVKGSARKTLVLLMIICVVSLAKWNIDYDFQFDTNYSQQEKQVKTRGRNLASTVYTPSWWEKTLGDVQSSLIGSLDGLIHTNLKDVKVAENKTEQPKSEKHVTFNDEVEVIPTPEYADFEDEEEQLPLPEFEESQMEDEVEDQEQLPEFSDEWEIVEDSNFGPPMPDSDNQYPNLKNNKKQSPEIYKQERSNRFQALREQREKSSALRTQQQKQTVALDDDLENFLAQITPDAQTMRVSTSVSCFLVIFLSAVFQYCLNSFSQSLFKYSTLNEIAKNPNAKVVTMDQAQSIIMDKYNHDNAMTMKNFIQMQNPVKPQVQAQNVNEKPSINIQGQMLRSDDIKMLMLQLQARKTNYYL